MKKLILFLSIATLFASSCSNKIGIAKRKYGRGYYVALSHQPKASSPSQTKEKIALKTSKKETESVNSVRVLPSVASSENAQNTAQNITSSAPVKARLAENRKGASFIASAAKTGNNLSVSELKSVKKLPLNLSAKSRSAAEDSVTLVLYVILCLFPFINLIPVYLHQGKKITNDFWITLILDIFLIFGVIYSLLVVLDVLSFA